jgi:anti-sigma factor RsiW
VLQPLDDINLGGDDVNLAHEGDGMFEEHAAWVGQVEGGEEEKENTPGSLAGAAGKAAATAAAAARGAGSGRMVWPADAETLLEQEAAGRRVWA